MCVCVCVCVKDSKCRRVQTGSHSLVSVKVNECSSILSRLEINHCDIWFIKFGVDYKQTTLALGNTVGRISLWDLTVDEPSKLKYYIYSLFL